MPTKNFSVGPSALFPGITDDIIEIAKSGILEKSHRSADFTEMSKNTILRLRKFLNVPEDYYVFYTSSASEAMEIALRNGLEKKSTHVANGAFGNKWQKMAKDLEFETQFYEGEFGERFEIDKIEVENDSEALFITGNETSTGAAFSPEDIKTFRNKFPDKLFCIDATSCAGAVNFDLSNCDCFVFSVQKCFGIPSGLGIFICSPRFFEKANQKKEKGGDIGTIHSLPAMWKKMEGKFQTSETPPVMQIALLGKVITRIQSNIGNLEKCAEYSREKAQLLWNFFENHSSLKPFVKNSDHYSNTVIVIEGSEEKIAEAKEKCNQNAIALANGYGKTKTIAFRIANFLTHTKEDHQKIFDILKDI